MQLQVLSDDDVNRIHEATLKVLEKAGVWFKDCPEAHELFAENGCRIEDGRVLFPPELTTDVLASVPDRSTLSPFFPGLGYAQPISVKQGETHFGLIGNAYYIYDHEAGAHRACLETDVADKLLILDSLANFEYDCCNLFTESQRGIGKPVVQSYSALADCTRFLRQWVCARAVSGRKKLPLGNRNCCPEESRLTTLGHAILEGVGATEYLLREGSNFPWVNPRAPCSTKLMKQGP